MKVDKSTWKATPFSQIGKSQLGKTLDSNKNTGKPYPYLCAFNVGYGSFNLSTVKTILLEDNELEKYLVRQGDLLICEGGETGRCAIWESDDIVYYQNALHRVRLYDSVNNRFIMRYMHYLKHIGIIDTFSHGRTIKHFTQKGLNRLVFNLPPFEQQCLIASELDALQEVIDGYREQMADLDALAQSIFIDTFGHVSINDKEWPIIHLGKLGSFKNGLNFDKQERGVKIKVIGVGDFKDLKRLDDFENISLIELTNISEEYLLRNEDIIFVRSNGNKNLVGRCLEVFPGSAAISYSGFCIRFRKNSDINNSYLLGILTDKEYKTAHILKSNGIGIQNINQKILTNLPIPVPPIELQQQFASQVEVIENQKDLLRQQLADAEMLMAERMQYYFS